MPGPTQKAAYCSYRRVTCRSYVTWDSVRDFILQIQNISFYQRQERRKVIGICATFEERLCFRLSYQSVFEKEGLSPSLTMLKYDQHFFCIRPMSWWLRVRYTMLKLMASTPSLET